MTERTQLIAALRGNADLAEKSIEFMDDDQMIEETRSDTALWRSAADEIEAYEHLRSEWDLRHDRGDHLVYRHEWEAFVSWRRGVRDGTIGGNGSHWDECWRVHIDCASAEIERLRSQ